MNDITIKNFDVLCTFAGIPYEDRKEFAFFMMGKNWESYRPGHLRVLNSDLISKVYRKWIEKGKPTFDQVCEEMGVNPLDIREN